MKDILSKEIPTKIPNESNSGYKNMSVALIKFNEIWDFYHEISGLTFNFFQLIWNISPNSRYQINNQKN